MADTPTSERTELLRDDELPIYEEARHRNPDITAEDALLLCSRLLEARSVSEREKRQFAAREIEKALDKWDVLCHRGQAPHGMDLKEWMRFEVAVELRRAAALEAEAKEGR